MTCRTWTWKAPISGRPTFRDADLSGSLLIDADFTDADLRGTNLNDTEIQGTKGLPKKFEEDEAD